MAISQTSNINSYTQPENAIKYEEGNHKQWYCKEIILCSKENHICRISERGNEKIFDHLKPGEQKPIFFKKQLLIMYIG